MRSTEASVPSAIFAKLTSIRPSTVAKVCSRSDPSAYQCDGPHGTTPPLFVLRNISSGDRLFKLPFFSQNTPRNTPRRALGHAPAWLLGAAPGNPSTGAAARQVLLASLEDVRQAFQTPFFLP